MLPLQLSRKAFLRLRGERHVSVQIFGDSPAEVLALNIYCLLVNMSVSFTEKLKSPSKKRKHGDANESKSSRKKSKTDITKSKQKGKEEDNQFRVVEASIVLSIPPRFAGEPMDGANEMLDSLLMRYCRSLVVSTVTSHGVL